MAGHIRDIGADRHMTWTEPLDDVVDVIEHRIKVPAAAEKLRNAADAHVPSAVCDSFDHLIGLTANVSIHCDRRRVTCNHWPPRCLCGLQAGLPTGMSDIDNDADAIHLRDRGSAKITQTTVGLLSTTVSEKVATVVGYVQHA